MCEEFPQINCQRQRETEELFLFVKRGWRLMSVGGDVSKLLATTGLLRKSSTARTRLDTWTNEKSLRTE